MSVAAVDAASKTVTVIDQEGGSSKVEARFLTNIEKAVKAKKGNPLELTTQGDGASVGIKEAKEEGYVKAKIGVAVQTYPAGSEVQVKAVDYTSKADGENIDIILPNGKLSSIKKADVKLFEAGVYNSETDINNNPKTDENKPDKITAKMEEVLSRVDSTLADLGEIKTYLDEDTSFSSESIEKCIAELSTYKKTLEMERENSSKASPAA